MMSEMITPIKDSFTVKLSFMGVIILNPTNYWTASLHLYALWPSSLVIMQAGMVFIRQEVAVWFQAE